MVIWDASVADCWVYTWKEGLLSPIAHDLKLRVTRFRIELSSNHQALKACFEARSFEVEAVMKQGRAVPGILSPRDEARIVASIERDVLRPSRYGDVHFQSTTVSANDLGYEVAGHLSLGGRRRAIVVRLDRENGRLTTRLPLHQPDYGIRPYTAMMGALKIKPGILVELSVPEP